MPVADPVTREQPAMWHTAMAWSGVIVLPVVTRCCVIDRRFVHIHGTAYSRWVTGSHTGCESGGRDPTGQFPGLRPVASPHDARSICVRPAAPAELYARGFQDDSTSISAISHGAGSSGQLAARMRCTSGSSSSAAGGIAETLTAPSTASTSPSSPPTAAEMTTVITMPPASRTTATSGTSHFHGPDDHG